MASEPQRQDPFRSARLVYRAVEPTEHEDFFYDRETDAVAQQNSGARIKPVSRKDAVDFMKHIIEKTLFGVVICLPVAEEEVGEDAEKEDKKEEAGEKKEKLIPIGQIHLGKGRGPNVETARHAGIAVDIVRAYRGKGYGTEAIKWITDWGFLFGGLHRVEIGCYSYNEGAKRLYPKLGFVYEGTKRECVFMFGVFHDIVEFGMLEGEWRELKEKGLW